MRMATQAVRGRVIIGLAISLAAAILASGGVLAADLDQIPRLRWMGSEPPVSFEGWMAGRQIEPFEVRALTVPGLVSSRAGGKALVVVNQALRPSIETRLNRYVADLAAQGYTVELYETSGGTPEAMKAFILANQAGLTGVVFVGAVPVPWFEMEHDFGDGDYTDFPCDLYYMELDGTWTDTDHNGKYDLLEAGSGDQGPEIFVGHIDASMMTGDEAQMINDYFDKNHTWWARTITCPEFGMTYTEDDWEYFDDFRHGIQYAYPDHLAIYAPDTDRGDYMHSQLTNPGYEFIQLSCHSWSGGHAFTRGGYAYSSEIRAVPPQAIFYNLFCCSASRWVETDHLGGTYIFNDSFTSLATVGSSKTGSMLDFNVFYEPFGQYHSLGESFRIWFDSFPPYSPGEWGWFGGMTICGDPFLQRYRSTVNAALLCSPESGTVPFSTTMSVWLTNTWPGQSRRLAARIDVQLGSGGKIGSWRAGYTNLGGGESYNVAWPQLIPALGLLIGENVFLLTARDVTPAPYNQPPYPPAGDTDSDACSVTAVLP